MSDNRVISKKFAFNVMTYNIHAGINLDEQADIDGIAEVIKKSNAEIVGLNEVDRKTKRGTINMAANNPWDISFQERKEGFIPLFNGANLDNWKAVGDDCWTFYNGMIVCGNDGHGWLRPKREFENFVLRLEYSLSAGCNSGIFVRTSEEGRPAYQGMEIQLIDDYGKEPDKRSTGAIYAAIAPSKNMNRPAGEWNQIEITADGRQIKVWLNGEEVINENLDDHPDELIGEKPPTPLKDRLTKGFIGLQNHGEPRPAYFRNIRIKEL